MPKAGKYEYPFFDLDACIVKLKELHVKTQSYQNKRSLVADALNMKEKGGGFAYLISSMEKYGLIQTGGGDVTITDLGKILMYGEPKEVEPAKSRAVVNVELFGEIAQKYGKNPQTEQIKLFLRDKANIDVSKAEKMAKNVDKIYKKVANYIVSVKKLAPSSEGRDFKGARFDRGETETKTEQEKTDLLKIQYGNLYLEVPKEDAETALRLVAQKLGIKLNSENPKK